MMVKDLFVKYSEHTLTIWNNYMTQEDNSIIQKVVFVIDGKLVVSKRKIRVESCFIDEDEIYGIFHRVTFRNKSVLVNVFRYDNILKKYILGRNTFKSLSDLKRYIFKQIKGYELSRERRVR